MITVLSVFLICLAYLIYAIFKLDYVNYEYYKNKTYDQITTSSVLKAQRGVIYDSEMNVLATTKTEWRVFVSTRDIKKASKESGKDYAAIISKGLSKILGLDEGTLYKKLTNSSVLDVTVKKGADEKEYKALTSFITEAGLEGLIFTEAQSTRYYPSGTLAAHVLGFVGSDSQGLYGLEYQYDKILSGKDGYYLYAKDANGNALSTEYSSYIPAEDGHSIVTTINGYVQGELEGILEKIRVNHGVTNRVTGVVMDTSTGAILAMATSSPFDPNSPFELDELSLSKLENSGYQEGSKEYGEYKSELLEIMWSNKAVSETYEPGSTFKIITVAAALDSGAATMSDTFSCNGYHTVGGWRIKCHKVTGHGSGFSLAYGLQMSCNPTMMTVAERIGAETFYSYVEKFGYFEKSGIDLPSEAKTIFHKKDAIGSTELATASFGQRFKVSIINQLTAIAAVANGGILVTPYLVEKVIDSNGNTVSEHTAREKGRVISEEVAREISRVLTEGVDGDGGAKNAAVEGYSVAAKTGTSQKFDVLDENGNSYLRIGSTVAYSPSDGQSIAVIIVVDEPTSSVKYGSVVAAPYVSELLSVVLPHLEYESDKEEVLVTVDNYVGKSVSDAASALDGAKINYEIIGNGKTVIAQTPSAGDSVVGSLSRIILYTIDTEKPLVTVPNLIGLSAYDATVLAIANGLNIKFEGISESRPSDKYTVSEQSLPIGARVEEGAVIVLKIMKTDFED